MLSQSLRNGLKILISLKAVTIWIEDLHFLDTSVMIVSTNIFESIDIFPATDIQSFLVTLPIRLSIILLIKENE